ncbi:ABC transporter substrate-binding protein [Microbispora corallina]|uniref:ABC transporter substrate-binding protein n=1 Tax=Microbispora corallina TaxID=83302 RepID=A0ABQ4FYX7_9ACTN|nr:extracellular solute-binding protein [Microbispora corallina]GIH39998.1 ABC transporter substrate-binding protein [Microbispora corallina]
MNSREKVVVRVWLNDYPVVPLFLTETKELARRFGEAHPEYEIEVRGCDFLELPRRVAEAARRGDPPAIVQNFYTSTQLARDILGADGGPLFTPVGRAVAGREWILGEPVVLDDLVPAARDYYTIDGELAAMPPLTSTTLLYANTTLLRAAGVTEVPRTWHEVEAAAKAVAALRGGPEHAITWPNHGWIFQQAVAQQGGLLADHGNGRSGRAETVDLASDEMLAFAEWWARLHREGHYLYTGVRAAGTDTYRAWEENYAAFAGQRTALVLSTSVEAERMVGAGREGGFTVVASPMPCNGEVPYAGNLIGGDSLWLSGGLDDATQDGALAFLQFMVHPANAAERHRTSGFIPITRASADLLEEEGWFDANPHHRVALDQLAAGDGSPAARGALLGDFVGIQDVMTAAMHDVLAHGAEPAARLTRATAEAQALLDDYNAHCLGTAPGPRGPNRFRVG